jgi:hypothetical protein
MVYNASAKRYSTQFEGKLSYHYNATDCSDQLFTFLDHPMQLATLEVWLSDIAGVAAGERFEYHLVFDAPGGGTVANFPLVTENPLGAVGKVFDYTYTIQNIANGSNPPWPTPGLPVEGDYSIVTDRALSISLKYKIQKTVPGTTGPACGVPR